MHHPTFCIISNILIFSPSTVMLIIAGGLQYAYPHNIEMIPVLVVNILVTVGFTIVCLYCTQDTQLKVAKFLTFIYSIIMAITIVGIILQVCWTYLDNYKIYFLSSPLVLALKPSIKPCEYQSFSLLTYITKHHFSSF